MVLRLVKFSWSEASPSERSLHNKILLLNKSPEECFATQINARLGCDDQPYCCNVDPLITGFAGEEKARRLSGCGWGIHNEVLANHL
jgi:hypothetical protein